MDITETISQGADVLLFDLDLRLLCRLGDDPPADVVLYSDPNLEYEVWISEGTLEKMLLEAAIESSDGSRSRGQRVSIQDNIMELAPEELLVLR